MAEATANLPIGIHPLLVSDQAVTVKTAIAEFMESLLAGGGDHPAVSFVALGVRPGLVVALAIPLTLAIVFSAMDLAHIDMQRISLGALIIALALLVDDAMTTIDATLTRLREGDTKLEAASFAFRTYAFSMLAGTLVTIAGLHSRRLAASSAANTPSRFRGRRDGAVASWFVAVLFAPLLGAAILKPPAQAESAEPGSSSAPTEASSRIRMRWLTIGLSLALFVASVLALPLIPRQFFRPPTGPSSWSTWRCRRTPRSLRARPSPTVRRAAQGRPGRRALEHLRRPRRDRFYLPLNVQLPNNFFSQAVVVAKDVPARNG